MSEYIIKLPNGGAADECIRLRGYEKSLYGYELHEEIVRCRNCKHYNDQEPDGEIGTCNLGLEDTGLVSIVEPNGFCSWGERRTDDD